MRRRRYRGSGTGAPARSRPGRWAGRVWLALAALGSAVWGPLISGWFHGVGKVPLLRESGSDGAPAPYPSLSVIVPARDEEGSVGRGVGSLLAQNYPGELEIIAVDDRSTDRTGEILERLRATRPDLLRVLRVDDLPEGWMGKNHALWLGASEARGEWLLFTDADVWFAPRCLRYAVNHALREGLDHLTLPPDIVSRGALLKAFVAAFALIFEATQRPWRAADPASKDFVGVGAFNLLRRDAYESVGTHRAVAMRPDDDMKLAKLVKEAGFRQGVAYGTGLVGVEWHRSLGGAVRGLRKSMFPGLDYRVEVAAVGAVVLLLTNVLPFAGVFLSRGLARVLFASNGLSVFAAHAYRARRLGSRGWLIDALLHPFSVCVFVYALARSVHSTLADGVEWRGTRYPLERLKENAP
jgi:glycosyltransferase involved in cell wall biosynthesis